MALELCTLMDLLHSMQHRNVLDYMQASGWENP